MTNRKNRRNVTLSTNATAFNNELATVETIAPVETVDTIVATDELVTTDETIAPVEVVEVVTTDEIAPVVNDETIAPVVATDETIAPDEPTEPVAVRRHVTHIVTGRATNGVTPTGRDGLCRKVWFLTDELTVIEGDTLHIPTLDDVRRVGIARGLNPGNIVTEYGRYRQYNGFARHVHKVTLAQFTPVNVNEPGAIVAPETVVYPL